MIKIKLLKESRQPLENAQGLYDLIDVLPGSIDIFLSAFTQTNRDQRDALKRFISGRYQSFIDGLTEQDIPETSARSYRTPLNKVKLFLQNGVTYWWYIVAGEKVAQQIIRFQVISYYMDLEEELGKVSKKKPQTDLFR